MTPVTPAPGRRLAADVAALVDRQRHAQELVEAENRHLLDALDRTFMPLPAEHPENVTYDPTWTPGGTV
ncbi:hypothetical protein [Streptomyces sp. NPDC001404]|uniref:hypothetical protein n=1 Tax=Streptomyces sp. NPDC001404 TaxID=3364571 RepID=UPI0036759610